MKKKSKFYKWCEKNKDKTHLKILLTIIAWCYLLLIPIILLIIFVPILSIIYYLIPSWALFTIGIIWLIMASSTGIITNAIFTNWTNKLYGNLKPCLNNNINKQELVPFDYQLADSKINSEAKKLTKKWETRQNSNKKIDKFLVHDSVLLYWN
ncbi:hypothetical protein [Spiroplasma sp. SV19]|uniref:hypothetical protein n=1 Tax=Spiroplasma sp. SV19 TaxID=2570468 RepID=UPI0024B76320|nr:hypothetical protein [Spiroplasma sp. SV19]WHQ36392.1 hypothetical protein E7Y35_00320 [Spiroplasma sp. SV19]